YSWGNHFIDDPRHFHSTDDRFGALLYQNISFKSNTDVTVGFDFNTYSGEIPVSGGNQHTAGSISTIDRKRITEYSPYVTAAQSLFSEQFIISAGLRVANSNMFGTKLVPQGGIVINPAHLLTIKLSASNGYRNPSFKDLYLYRMANPDLKPEDMWNYELSVGKRFSRYFRFDITGYYSKGSNIIQVVDMKNQNTGKFINKGIEISASSQPLDNLNISASYSWLHTSLDNLTGAPRNQYFLGVDWQIIKPLNVSAELKGVGGLFVSETIKHQNYALVNLRAEYNVNKYFSLFLRLNNITDARYMINRGYEMPGFNIMGGFRIRI
ncbi:MAG: TonB-dependent receptor, partial [Muribaculaceae bacterium]|nr:TonB-dependent receptor [Muribaculaceae bacterium]